MHLIETARQRVKVPNQEYESAQRWALYFMDEDTKDLTDEVNYIREMERIEKQMEVPCKTCDKMLPTDCWGCSRYKEWRKTHDKACW